MLQSVNLLFSVSKGLFIGDVSLQWTVGNVWMWLGLGCHSWVGDAKGIKRVEARNAANIMQSTGGTSHHKEVVQSTRLPLLKLGNTARWWWFSLLSSFYR
jgi:hypothetical protein